MSQQYKANSVKSRHNILFFNSLRVSKRGILQSHRGILQSHRGILQSHRGILVSHRGILVSQRNPETLAITALQSFNFRQY